MIEIFLKPQRFDHLTPSCNALCLACKYHKGLMDRVLCELSALKDLETFLKNSEDGNWELKVLGCVTVWICCCLQSFIYTLEE